jgi:hypothetical protein
MADFCTKCSEHMFGNDVTPEIDVEKIAETLENDHYAIVLCEGCGMRAVGKSDDGHIYLAFAEEDQQDVNNEEHVMVKWITLDEYENMDPSSI